jgi:hypothetical protein
LDKANVPPELLSHLQFGAGYFLLSLLAAVWNLFRIPTMVQRNADIAYDVPTVAIEVGQLLFLVFGAVHLLAAILQL